jgi:hypothetical protein
MPPNGTARHSGNFPTTMSENPRPFIIIDGEIHWMDEPMPTLREILDELEQSKP